MNHAIPKHFDLYSSLKKMRADQGAEPRKGQTNKDNKIHKIFHNKNSVEYKQN